MNIACPCCEEKGLLVREQPFVGYHCPRCHHFFRIAAPSEGSDSYQDKSGRSITNVAQPQRKYQDRYEFVQSLLRPDIRILEIGCAEGLFGKYIRENYAKRVHLTGIEVSRDALAAGAIFDHIHHGTVETFEAEGDFDLILIFHVLEHIDEPSSMIQFCRERLAPNGRLVVEVPYGAGNLLVPWDGHGEHCQFFSTASLSVLLEGRGFSVQKMVNGCYESATYNDSLRVMSRLAVTAEQKVALFQQRFGELFQGRCIVFGVGKDFQNWFAPYLDQSAVVAVCDNAPKVQGSQVMGKVVQTPLAAVQGRGGVKILVATFRYTSEIIAQLLDMGVREEEIVTTEQFFARSL